MALRYICLISVLLGSALAKDVDLTGVIARAPACPAGQPCPAPPAPTGEKKEIWHCDGTCTNVYLRCDLDGFDVTIEPPAGSKQSHALVLGGPGLEGHHQIEKCDSKMYGPPVAGIPREGPFGSPVHRSISYDRCGTASVESTDPMKPHCREYHNSLLLTEYLLAHVAGPLVSDHAVHVVSNTTFNIKCCNCGGTSTDECPREDLPIRRELRDCTNKSFELTCSSIEDTERYCCSLALRAGETLPADVDYYPENCYGVDSDMDNGGTYATVQLFQPVNSHFQVNVARNDDLSYSFGGPWFQFDRPSSTIDPPHRVEVRCDVKLGAKNAITTFSGPSCTAPSQPRSGAGFFQAGGLTLLKSA